MSEGRRVLLAECTLRNVEAQIARSPDDPHAPFSQNPLQPIVTADDLAATDGCAFSVHRGRATPHAFTFHGCSHRIRQS